MDDIDQRILRELQKDGRQTHQQLSDKVSLSPSPCARRIKRLEEDGYIRGYVAQIDEQKMGFSMSIFVSVKLDKQIDDLLVSFERAIALFPEVVDCWLMTGGFDYLLRVAVQDLDDFERFLTTRLTKVDGVTSIKSSIPIRRVKEQLARII